MTYYLLNFKKLAYFGLMFALAGFTFMNTMLPQFVLTGITLGVSVYCLIPILPNKLKMFCLGSILIAPFLSPVGQIYSLSMIALITYQIWNHSGQAEFRNKMRPMNNETEKEAISIVNKLEKKTKIQVKERVCVIVDPQKHAPSAAAAIKNISENTIIAYSNILASPFSKKEIKAIFAHEFGHLHGWHTYDQMISLFLWYLTTMISLLSFPFPLALGLGLANTFSYYAILQINELLADYFSAQHSDPVMLISALNKLNSYSKLNGFSKRDPKNKKQDTLWKTSKLYLRAFKQTVGFSSHPKTKLRNDYLSEYAKNKK